MCVSERETEREAERQRETHRECEHIYIDMIFDV